MSGGREPKPANGSTGNTEEASNELLASALTDSQRASTNHERGALGASGSKLIVDREPADDAPSS